MKKPMKSKKSMWAWEEVGKWILFLILIIALIVIIALLFGGAQGVWERIRNIISFGG